MAVDPTPSDPTADPLWPAFAQWLKHREVTPHCGQEMRDWEAFKAGADAAKDEVKRVFERNGLYEVPTPSEG